MNNQNMNNITACTNESHEISINITGKAFNKTSRKRAVDQSHSL